MNDIERGEQFTESHAYGLAMHRILELVEQGDVPLDAGIVIIESLQKMHQHHIDVFERLMRVTKQLSLYEDWRDG